MSVRLCECAWQDAKSFFLKLSATLLPSLHLGSPRAAVQAEEDFLPPRFPATEQQKAPPCNTIRENSQASLMRANEESTLVLRDIAPSRNHRLGQRPAA